MKSAANIFQVKFGDHCFIHVIGRVYRSSMHCGGFTVMWIPLSAAQTQQKASEPFMEVNLKFFYLPSLYKLTEIFPYLMIEKPPSFVKPSPVIEKVK